MPRKPSYEYREGELELILSLAPTSENLQRLAKVLGRSESALQLVYRAAFGHGVFPEGKAFNRKVLAAKKTLGIDVGRKNLRKQSAVETPEAARITELTNQIAELRKQGTPVSIMLTQELAQL